MKQKQKQLFIIGSEKKNESFTLIIIKEPYVKYDLFQQSENIKD
jgi:hypothetical protein